MKFVEQKSLELDALSQRKLCSIVNRTEKEMKKNTTVV